LVGLVVVSQACSCFSFSRVSHKTVCSRQFFSRLNSSIRVLIMITHAHAHQHRKGFPIKLLLRFPIAFLGELEHFRIKRSHVVVGWEWLLLGLRKIGLGGLLFFVYNPHQRLYFPGILHRQPAGFCSPQAAQVCAGVQGFAQIIGQRPDVGALAAAYLKIGL